MSVQAADALMNIFGFKRVKESKAMNNINDMDNLSDFNKDQHTSYVKLALLKDIDAKSKPVLEVLAKHLADKFGNHYGKFVVHNVNDGWEGAYDDDTYTLWIIMMRDKIVGEHAKEMLFAVAENFMNGVSYWKGVVK